MRASPGLAIPLAAVVVCSAAASSLVIVTIGLLIGAMPDAIRSGIGSGSGRHMVAMLIAFGVVAISGVILSTLQSALASSLRLRVAATIDQRLIAASTGPRGIAHLEDPAYADQLRLVTGDEWQPEMLAEWLPAVIAPRLQAIGLAFILARFTWWAPLILGLAAALTYWRYLRFADSVHASMATSADVMRRVGYLRGLMVEPDSAKELRLFGLRGWLADRMAGTWRAGMASVWESRRRSQREAGVSILVLLVAEGSVLTSLALTATNGGVSLAALAVFIQSAVALPMLGWIGDPDYLARKAIASLGALADLESSSQAAAVHGDRRPADRQPSRDITFESVDFGYPGTGRDVLRQLNLRIPAGKSVAIVGVNGAGKTTLIKLLTRLYDPDRGHIRIDGTDLREFDPDAWRAKVAVVYQDFVKYPLTLQANVGFGDLRKITDVESLERALDLAGGSGLTGESGVRWDTVLSRQFEGGTDLSGGQWQKVALARGLLAAQQGSVLILDEPTANMDVRAEAVLYDRFLELTRGLTTILVSHRFSGVRKADLIYVLDGGQVAEKGSHAELMARNGRYAAMFRLQASRFTSEDDQDHPADEPGVSRPVSPATVPVSTSGHQEIMPPELATPRSLAGSIAALGTLLRGCLREPRRLVIRGLLLVPAAAAAGALQALWVRTMIDGISDHTFAAAIAGTLALIATIGIWQAFELVAATDRITLSERVGFAFDQMVAELTAGIPSLRHHESPVFLDRLYLLRSRMLGLGGLLNWCLNMLQDLGGFVITAVLLATVFPPLLLLMAAGLAALWLQAAGQRILARAQDASAPGYRLAARLMELTVSASAGKEIRGFRLEAEISRRQRAARTGADAIMSKAQWRVAAAGGASGLLNTMSMVAAVGVVAVLAAHGHVSLGGVLLVFLLVSRFIGHASGLVDATGVVVDRLQSAERFRWLSAYARSVRPPAATERVPAKMRHGITLDGISFRYPGTSAPVLNDISVHLPAGTVVALVGENGSGKSTLVKTLCRLYEPSAGTIRVDGVRLDALDPELWQASLSAGFQDFVRFEFYAGLTVGFGDLPHLEDQSAIVKALERAGAAELAGALPDGLRTQLGKRWPGGTDLSDGQWQKLAVSRALMSPAPLMLVLDEPTASLDAETEYSLFEHLIAAARSANGQGTITVLVSHRFSTVRSADVIVVLDGGAVAEVGGHKELMAKGGLYAEMYKLQALAYA